MKPPGPDDDLTTAVFAIARALRDLGTGDACTPMGGLEALGVAVVEGGGRIADALNNVAEAIRGEHDLMTPFDNGNAAKPAESRFAVVKDSNE